MILVSQLSTLTQFTYSLDLYFACDRHFDGYNDYWLWTVHIGVLNVKFCNKTGLSLNVSVPKWYVYAYWKNKLVSIMHTLNKSLGIYTDSHQHKKRKRQLILVHNDKKCIILNMDGFRYDHLQMNCDYICEWSYLKINYPNFDHNICD